VGFDVKTTRFDKAGGLQAACDEAEYYRAPTIAMDAQFATGTVNPITVIDDAWKTCYERIRMCNIFLKETKERRPVFQDNRLKSYRGEARFLRAWYYHILLKHYGGVPIVYDEIYSIGDAIKTERDTYETCVNYILEECDLAMEDLLLTAPSGNEYGRAGKGACLALKARVLLFAASPLFNGSDFAKDFKMSDGTAFPKDLVGYPEYDHERWKYAMDAANEVLTVRAYGNKYYTLYGLEEDENFNPHTQQIEPGFGFYALFNYISYKVDGQREPYKGNIFEKMAGGGGDRTSPFWPPSWGSNSRGGWPYQELVDAFPMNTGVGIFEENSGYDERGNPYANRDPRFYNTITTDQTILATKDALGEPPRPVNIALDPNGKSNDADAVRLGTKTGYYFRKPAHRFASINYYVLYSETTPLIRIAEIKLAYAEAANEYYPTNDDAPASDIAYKELSDIRKRAGIIKGEGKYGYGLKDNMTKAQMREVIRNEKRIEFALEGHRFWDVRRWMIAETTDNKTMTGMEPRKISGGDPNARTFTRFDLPKHVFKKAMYLWPIPYNEVTKSDKMIQNPYY